MDLLELHGASHVIEHVAYEYSRKQREEAYREYTADMLLGLYRAWGGTIDTRYSELVKVSTQEPDNDEKTADEIVLSVMKKAGLKGREDGCNESDGEAIS